jgi:hypothetical protein
MTELCFEPLYPAPKPIETKYKGYRFRSRLEARWAVFFDALFIEWEYESEGYDLGKEFGWYLPDFYIPRVEMFAEVKPDICGYYDTKKYSHFAKVVNKTILFLVGPPEVRFYNGYTPDGLTIGHFISNHHNYYTDERRFYSCPGYPTPSGEGVESDEDYKAVEAARSARFEHGESP